MYEEGFDLLSDISTRYEAPLYLVVIRVAYWECIRNLLSPEQKNELLQIETAAIKESTDDRFLAYFIDGTP
ncbi:diguanylate cyclase, partial [Enterococcus faecalis]